MFYTNISIQGNNVLFRGVEKGRRIQEKIGFSPYLFVPTKKNSEYKTLFEESLEKITFENIREARDFIKKYEDVENFKIYGQEKFEYAFIADQFKSNVDWNLNDIKIAIIDIETAKDEFGAFPDPYRGNGAITAITLKYLNDKTYVFGYKNYEIEGSETFIRCSDERDLCKRFLNIWTLNYPDIVSGWNCLPIKSNIWGRNKILKLDSINPGDILYDSYVKVISPKSNKCGVKQILSNGASIISSYDHIFPYTLCAPETYTNFSGSPKDKSYKKDMTVKDIMKMSDEKFVFVPLRNNTNIDNLNFTLDECYLLGLIYTDGSLKNKHKLSNGFSIYQSDLSFIEVIKEKFNIPSKIVGPYKNCYQLHIPSRFINNIEAIYNINKKKLNIEILSTLSKKQFYMFLSGLLDGDGCNSGNAISLCNYNDDIIDLYELCLWNGIFSTITKNKNLIRFLDINLDNLSLMKNKRWGGIKYNPLKRNSSNKSSKINYKKIGSGYLVKVSDFEEIDSMEMMDIETNTHYFVSSGVKVHNCNGYDIPYIINRFNIILGESETKKLSPWNNIWSRNVVMRGKNTIQYYVTGISLLDYIDLYRWYAPGGNSKESYKLDFIATEELGEGKVDYEEFDNLDELYEKDYQKFIRYNIKDTELVINLDEKLKLLELALSIAYDTKVNYEDVFSQTRMWDSLCYNYLLEKNIIIPLKEIGEKSEAYEGAYVKQPIPGKYHNIVSIDIDSMYPHIMQQFNLSPEMVVDTSDYTKEMWNILSQKVSVDSLLEQKIDLSNLNGYTLTPNGQFFKTNKQGFLSKMLEEMYEDRKKYKKLMLECKKQYQIEKNPLKLDQLKNDIAKYNNLQLAKKINLVSIYGASGSKFYRFYDIRIALAVTLSGQLAIRWLNNKINQYMNNLLKTVDVDYVLYGDTDSLHINFDPLIKKLNVPDNKIVDFIDKVCEDKIQEVIEKSYKELANYLKAYKPALRAKREKIIKTGIFTAKKRYALNVWDNEGVRYSEPQISITGLEMIKSSTPIAIRNKMKEILKIILNDTEENTQKFIAEFKKEFRSLPVESIAFPRGVNGIIEYSDSNTIYKKGSPIHVKGCILYNNYLNQKGLDKKYLKIQDGDKIKFTYLKQPNPLRSPVISFLNKLPVEMGLHSFVDYDTMWSKVFIDPIKIILDAIGWKVEQQFNLESFFGD